MNLLSLFFSFAMAAIPPITMIFDRTVEQNPAVTQYTQNLQFENSGYLVKETWVVSSPQRLYLTAEVNVDGQVFVLRREYAQHKKETLVGSQRTSVAIPPEFFEPLTLVRDRADLQQMLADMGIATSQDLTQRYYKKNADNTFDYYPHPSMVLSRSEGAVNYLLYKGNYPETVNKGIWIEQDKFAIRKVKFDPETALTYTKYFNVGKATRFPFERRFTMGTESVVIKNTSAVTHKVNVPATLGPSNFSEIPESGKTHALIDFYQRYR